MSVSFKKPDGTLSIDGDDYRRHINSDGGPGGLVGVHIAVGENVTIPRGLMLHGAGVVVSGTTVTAASQVPDITIWTHDSHLDD